MSARNSQTTEDVAPVIFSDGSALYTRFMEEYVVHDRGYFLVAPSGSGKTYFVNAQTKKHWIDGDDLWIASGAHPAGDWWNASTEVVYAVDQRSDVITAQARRLGLWVVGASNYWLVPDAVVLPNWETHQRYIRERESHDYDGGATAGQLQLVLEHRTWLAKLASEENLPVFETVQDAAATLAASLEIATGINRDPFPSLTLSSDPPTNDEMCR